MSSLKDRLAAQRAAIATSKAAFTRSYKWKVGKTYFRLLPGMDTADDFSRDYGAHYIKDATDKIIAVVGDAEICYGTPCPVREAITQVLLRVNDTGDEAASKRVKGWLAKKSNVTNIEILGGVDTENKGKVWQAEFSETQWDAILSAMETMVEANPEWNMEKGIALVCEREGTGQTDTKYKWSVFPAEVPAPTQAILDQRMNLGSYVDGKFGMSVNKALTALSTMLGRDVSQSAVGAALANYDPSKGIEGPKAGTTVETVVEVDPLAGLGDDDLPDSLKGDTAVDAEFTEPVEAETPAAPAANAELDSIMAELDNL